VSRIWVCNASPVIILSKAEALFLLYELAERILIPEGVRDELIVKAGQDIKNFLKNKKVKVVKVKNIEPKIIEWGLGKGESQVISLVYNNPTYEAILDDEVARECTKSLSLKLRGSIGIVLLAKRKGIIKEASPILKKFLESGIYLKEELLTEALALVGEKWDKI